MLMEKYCWTPMEIDQIPKEKMDEIMLLLNAKINVDAEVKFRVENKGAKNANSNDRSNDASNKSLGSGSIKGKVSILDEGAIAAWQKQWAGK